MEKRGTGAGERGKFMGGKQLKKEDENKKMKTHEKRQGQHTSTTVTTIVGTTRAGGAKRLLTFNSSLDNLSVSTLVCSLRMSRARDCA